ncbi:MULTISPECIES: beta-phosphoglucomutase [unclassified Leeuwenhoekiella]|uniref:beta-phosphoglucomutase n=1 Tax=unclassified Leeuwenhoekiella TaxID=2615029 RepID=UPI000C656320|nr:MULTISPECIES: beta-phosphoglucomutase [unclassified Leeuwenhoekiella]MBA80503.1 beta-phosphoglucomutase [Leeuwenhoekiella sp.]|tara:strand:- start:104467 stop:105126 length:660 start_codon:yes stop_codon:yes gene_type:complete
MAKKGFIFDLDGVIVDTAGFHYLAWRSLANELGFEFTEEQNERFKGVSRVRSLEILLEIGGVEATQEQKDKWLVSKNEEYLSYIEKMTDDDILPGVMNTLNYLKSQNIPMALGSASKNAQPILKRVGLFNSFQVIVDGNHVQKAKPDPEVFTIGADELGFAYTDVIVFEDSIAGIQAANSVDMVSVGIGDADVLHEADHNFKDFTEIDTAFLDQLINAK